MRLLGDLAQCRKADDAHALFAFVTVLGRQLAALRRARIAEDLAAVAAVVLAPRQREHRLARLARGGGTVWQPLGALLKEKRLVLVDAHRLLVGFHKSTSQVLCA
jgi:hypothetical protein